MAKQNPNLLLVEGKDEQYTLPYFMDHYVVWGDRKEEWVVEIKEFDGVEKLIKPGVIEAQSKTPGVSALGIIVDANESFDSRWASVRDRCQKAAPGFPVELPREGLIHVTPSGKRSASGSCPIMAHEACWRPSLASCWARIGRSCGTWLETHATAQQGSMVVTRKPIATRRSSTPILLGSSRPANRCRSPSSIAPSTFVRRRPRLSPAGSLSCFNSLHELRRLHQNRRPSSPARCDTAPCPHGDA